MRFPSVARWRSFLSVFWAFTLVQAVAGQQNGYESLLPRQSAPPPTAKAHGPVKAQSRRYLNDLLAEIQDLHKRGMFGPKIPLDPKILAAITLTRGAVSEDIGLLNKSGALSWPETLKAAVYEKERKLIDQRLTEAIKQVRKGVVPAELAKEINQASRKLQDILDQNVSDLNPDQYIESTRFLRKMPLTMTALQRKDVHDYFQAAEDLPKQCRTVRDLIQYMTDKKFRFGTGAYSNEASNTIYNKKLYKALEAYEEKAQAPRGKDK